MVATKKVLLAGMFGLSAAYNISPMSSLSRLFNKFPLGYGHNNADMSRFSCDLGKPLDPSDDGLYSSHDLFSTEETIKTLVERHQPLVKIESICYDDLGDFEDDRWGPFYDIPKVLENKSPTVSVSHNAISVEQVR